MSRRAEQEVHFTEVPLQDCTCHTPPFSAHWTTIRTSKSNPPPHSRGGHSWYTHTHTASAPRLNPCHPLPSPTLSHLPSLPSPAVSTFDPSTSSVLIFGGSTRTARFFNDLHLYSLTHSTFTSPSPPSSPPPRSGHSAVLHPPHLLIYGGQHLTLPPPTSPTFYSDVWAFDLHTHTWSHQPTQGREVRRNGHAAVVWQGAMYVVGGSDEGGPRPEVMRLDLQTWRWTELRAGGDEVDARELHGLALDGQGRLWMAGGRSERGVLHSLHSLDLSQLMPCTTACTAVLSSLPIEPLTNPPLSLCLCPLQAAESGASKAKRLLDALTPSSLFLCLFSPLLPPFPLQRPPNSPLKRPKSSSPLCPLLSSPRPPLPPPPCFCWAAPTASLSSTTLPPTRPHRLRLPPPPRSALSATAPRTGTAWEGGVRGMSRRRWRGWEGVGR